jgi:hypothetical protein
MSPPIPRSRHSELPAVLGNVPGFILHLQGQRDLWEMVLPSAHLRTLDVHGPGVLSGLRVSAELNARSVTVGPGEALDPGGRLLVVSLSADANDPRVRLRPSANALSLNHDPDGLGSVGPDGAVVDTNDASGDPLTGEHYLILEWNESLLKVRSEPVYRLTPWLRLEPATAETAQCWVVLAQVMLGAGAEQRQVTDVKPGTRRLLSSLQGGLTLQQPVALNAGLAVGEPAASWIEAGAAGGLVVSSRSVPSADWRHALVVDGPTGHVGIGVEQPEHPLHVNASLVHDQATNSGIAG